MLNRRDSITPLGIFLLFAAVAAAFSVYRRASREIQPRDSLLRIQRTGIVRIGYANEAPYGYLDSATGEITGEAPEIAKVILTRIGAQRIESVVTEFGSLIPGLKANRFDVIAAGMYITPERSREIDFSNPSYAIGEAFLVAAMNPLELNSFEEVAKHATARIGVLGGSVEHGYARQLGVPDERILVFPDYASAVAGLRTGRVDAVAATVLTASDLLRKQGSDDIELARPFHDPVIDGKSVRGYGAFGFRKEDDRLREAFNQYLREFVGTPEHLDLVRPFGFSEDTLPGEVTAEQIAGEN
jgi:polar amino acid transport system substrate-binding protein